MSGPMKSAEPSMDEILASIRKIISDDPTKGPAEAAVPTFQTPSLEAAPRSGSQPLGRSEPGLPSPTTSAPPVDPAAQGGRQTPSFGRLSEALRTTFSGSEQNKPSGSFASMRFGQSAPTSPLSDAGRGLEPSLPEPVFGVSDERSRSIANEMDDILNEPLPADDTPSPAAPAAAGNWAVWRTPASGKPGAPAQESVDAASAPFGSAAPSGAGLTPTSKPGAAPPMSFGRSSGGFYPAGSPSPSFDKPNRFEPQLPSADEPASPGFGAIVPQRDTAGPATPPAGGTAFTPSPRFEPLAKPEPASPGLPRAEPSSAKPAPVVIAAMPASPAVTLPAAKVEEPAAPIAPTPASATAPPGVTAGAAGTGVPLPPRSTIFSRPLISPKPGDETAPAAPASVMPPPRSGGLAFNAAKPAATEAPAVARAPAPAVAAPSASQALDALAAGLAASNTSPPTVPGAAAPQGPAGRSLEDLVTDMVKPMLQRWIDDNMPRIIEKALRSETQGSGQKPPGA